MFIYSLTSVDSVCIIEENVKKKFLCIKLTSDWFKVNKERNIKGYCFQWGPNQVYNMS